MSGRDLNRMVARRTGESVVSIERLGFQVLEDVHIEASLGPLVLDWDRHEPAYLGHLLLDDDWPGRASPLPSHDEGIDDELDEEYACEAA